MTVSTSARSQTFLGNGATSIFAFSFIAISADYIVVTYVDASGNSSVLPKSAYTPAVNAPVSGALWGIGGTVTYAPGGSPIAAGSTLTVARVLPLVQQSSISNQGNIYLSAIEQALDILTMGLQQVAAALVDTVQAPVTDISPAMTLPAAKQRAGKYLAFDSSGNAIAALASPGSTPISSLMQPVVAAATAGAALAALGAMELIPTIASLRSLSLAAPGVVWVAGYYTGADGGEGIFWCKSGDTTSADNGGTIIVDAAGRRWYRSGAGPAVTLKQFGAKFDGASDDTAAWTAAVAWLTATGGGKIFAPVGKSIISSTITIGISCISIVGIGRGGTHDAAPLDVAATMVSWAGAVGGTMFQIAPAGTQRLENCDFVDVFLQGNGIAGIGLNVISCCFSQHRIAGSNTTTSIIQYGCATALSESADCQYNDIWVNGFQEATTDGAIFICGGTATANFSFNRIHEITGDHCHYAIIVGNSDNNDFYFCDAFRVPLGSQGLVLLATNTAGCQCRANTFWHASFNGGILSQGTTSGTYPAVNNQIIFVDQENGTPAPSVGAGSTLWWGGNHAPIGLRAALNGSYNQIVCQDGRMRYSGESGAIAAGSSTTITFPTPFSSAIIFASATPEGSVATQWSVAPTTTTITIFNNGSTAANFWWAVEGY